MQNSVKPRDAEKRIILGTQGLDQKFMFSHNDGAMASGAVFRRKVKGSTPFRCKLAEEITRACGYNIDCVFSKYVFFVPAKSAKEDIPRLHVQKTATIF